MIVVMGVACVFLLPSRAESLVLLCCKREIEAPSRDKETELRDEREKRLFFREGGRGMIERTSGSFPVSRAKDK